MYDESVMLKRKLKELEQKHEQKSHKCLEQEFQIRDLSNLLNTYENINKEKKLLTKKLQIQLQQVPPPPIISAPVSRTRRLLAPNLIMVTHYSTFLYF